MRKAKTPPKRKPVPAGRRAAKRKPEKGARSQLGKAGKAGKVGKVAKTGKTGKTGALAKMATAGKVADGAGPGGKSPGKAVGKAAIKPVNKVALTRTTTAGPKVSARPNATPAAGTRGLATMASSSPAGQRAGHDGKTSKKVSVERVASKPAPGPFAVAPRGEGAAPGRSAEKPVEAAAPASLPTPIASFTI